MMNYMMRRGKVVMKRIENEANRLMSFTKGRNELLKKALELSVLCDVEVAVIIFSQKGRLYEFSSSEIQNAVERYSMHTKEIPTHKPEMEQHMQIDFDQIRSGMDFFHNAKAVLLRRHHDNFLLAEEDEESVSSKNARWTIGFASGSQSIIHLKSCYRRYLTTSNQPFLPGKTGRKVFQAPSKRLNSSLELEARKMS